MKRSMFTMLCDGRLIGMSLALMPHAFTPHAFTPHAFTSQAVRPRANTLAQAGRYLVIYQGHSDGNTAL